MDAAALIRELADAVEFAVHVRPRSRREQARGSRSGALAVRVRVPPADGQANRAVCRVLAEALEVPASAVRLIAGARSRHKRIRIEGPSQELAARISALGSAPEN